MIRTEAGLLQSIELLENMYHVLAEFHRDIAPRNFRNYQIFAEGPIEEIRRLQHDIHEYLQVSDMMSAETHRA